MSGAIVLTGSGVTAFRYASLKGQLRMESVGMKSSGGALRPRLAQEFGLGARAPHADYIAYCETALKELRECIGA